MTANLVIVGAGGFGREVYGIAAVIAQIPEAYVAIKGFLDDRTVTGSIDPTTLPAPALGSPAHYVPQANDAFVVALGDPAQRQQYAAALAEKGVRFLSLLPPQAMVADYERHRQQQAGVCVGFFCTVSSGVRFGQHVTLASHSSIGHDCVIGDYTHIGSFVFVGGGVTIGRKVTIHPKATILPGLSIGDGATVGAGSVVIAPVKPGVTVFGNPAMPVR